MGWLFEEEKPGIEGEPARLRVFFKLAFLGWGLFFLLWQSGWPVLKMFGALFALGALAASAKALFHLVTVAITRLPDNLKTISQVLVALTAAAVPFAYLIRMEWDLTDQILIKAYSLSWSAWLIMAFFVYLAYAVSQTFPPPIVRVRRYLIATALVFLIVFLSGHGVFSTYDEEGFPEGPPLDPNTIEGQVGMAASYLRLVILAYGTILYIDIRRHSRFL